jgi:hypothetical protein
LVKWKFKDWKVTETKRRTVTDRMKKQRATTIAAQLNNIELWKSHARGISMEVIRRVLNLTIDDFGENIGMKDRIDSYYRLLKDYMARRGHDAVIHADHSYVGI